MSTSRIKNENCQYSPYIFRSKNLPTLRATELSSEYLALLALMVGVDTGVEVDADGVGVANKRVES